MDTITIAGNAHGFRLVNHNPARKTSVTIHRNGHASHISLKPRETKAIAFKSVA